jgi:hypothetical protein
MGYTAYTIDSYFTVPAANIPAALDALNAKLSDLPDGMSNPEMRASFTSLTDVFDQNTGFDSSVNEAGDWMLGYHTDNYYDIVEELIIALAPFVRDGSYVRFQGEDDTLWGFVVVNGRIEYETGHYTWKIVPRRDGSTPTQPDPDSVKLAAVAELIKPWLNNWGHSDIGDLARSIRAVIADADANP